MAKAATAALVARLPERDSGSGHALDEASIGSGARDQRELFDIQEQRLLGIVTLVAVALLAVLLAGVLAHDGQTSIRTSPSPSTLASIVVPDVAGLTAATAANELKSYGLNVVTSPQGGIVVTPGEVVAESPSSGSVLSPGSTVKLVISAGPSAVQSHRVTTRKQAGVIWPAPLVREVDTSARRGSLLTSG